MPISYALSVSSWDDITCCHLTRRQGQNINVYIRRGTHRDRFWSTCCIDPSCTDLLCGNNNALIFCKYRGTSMWNPPPPPPHPPNPWYWNTTQQNKPWAVYLILGILYNYIGCYSVCLFFCLSCRRKYATLFESVTYGGYPPKQIIYH